MTRHNASARVVLYGTAYCPYCVRARALLESKGVEYEDIGLEGHPGRRREMEQRSGRRTVPQIFIDDEHIGGSDDLFDLEQAGELDRLLGLTTDIERN